MAQRWSSALQEAWPDGFCWRECAQGRSRHLYRRVDLRVTRVSWPAAILNARFKALRCRIQADIHVKPPTLPAKQRRTITSMFGVSEQKSVREDQLCPLFCIVCVPFWNCDRTLKDVWAPPSGVMVSLQLLPVSAAQTSRLLWPWPKETPSLWCVTPVASHPPAWSGGRMVSMRITKQGQVVYSMWPSYLNSHAHIFQDPNSNLTKDWGFCQEVGNCRSQALRGPTQPLIPAQPPAHQASPPKSTACRFMVH